MAIPNFDNALAVMLSGRSVEHADMMRFALGFVWRAIVSCRVVTLGSYAGQMCFMTVFSAMQGGFVLSDEPFCHAGRLHLAVMQGEYAFRVCFCGVFGHVGRFRLAGEPCCYARRLRLAVMLGEYAF